MPCSVLELVVLGLSVLGNRRLLPKSGLKRVVL